MELTCVVCREEYWTGRREPLVLPCGHTFCRQCIVSLALSHNVGCPTCRRNYRSINVDRLPKNFALLGIAMNRNGLDICREHCDPMRLWCTECEEGGCGECMFNSHPKEQHNVVHIRTKLNEMKRPLQDQASQLLQTTEQEMVKREAPFRSYWIKMLRLLRENRKFYDWDKQLRDMLQKMDNITDVASLKSVKETLRTLSEKMDGTLASFTEEESDSSAGRCNSSRSSERAVMDPLGMQVTMSGGRNWRLTWQDGRLLLCSQRDPVQQQTLQLVAVEYLVSSEDTEVFLELSVDQTVLGRVFVRLWSYLRRAQHFLALCLGTLGPSFVGAKLLEVTSRNEPEESVTCGEYITGRGGLSSEALMAGLEWDGEHGGQRREGLVVASSGGAPELDARFGISTSSRAGGWVRCPFGQVVSGMEVVRKALENSPVSRVRVTSCGLVLKHRL